MFFVVDIKKSKYIKIKIYFIFPIYFYVKLYLPRIYYQKFKHFNIRNLFNKYFL